MKVENQLHVARGKLDIRHFALIILSQLSPSNLSTFMSSGGMQWSSEVAIRGRDNNWLSRSYIFDAFIFSIIYTTIDKTFICIFGTFKYHRYLTYCYKFAVILALYWPVFMGQAEISDYIDFWLRWCFCINIRFFFWGGTSSVFIDVETLTWFSCFSLF